MSLPADRLPADRLPADQCPTVRPPRRGRPLSAGLPPCSAPDIGPPGSPAGLAAAVAVASPATPGGPSTRRSARPARFASWSSWFDCRRGCRFACHPRGAFNPGAQPAARLGPLGSVCRFVRACRACRACSPGSLPTWPLTLAVLRPPWAASGSACQLRSVFRIFRACFGPPPPFGLGPSALVARLRTLWFRSFLGFLLLGPARSALLALSSPSFLSSLSSSPSGAWLPAALPAQFFRSSRVLASHFLPVARLLLPGRPSPASGSWWSFGRPRWCRLVLAGAVPVAPPCAGAAPPWSWWLSRLWGSPVPVCLRERAYFSSVVGAGLWPGVFRCLSWSGVPAFSGGSYGVPGSVG